MHKIKKLFEKFNIEKLDNLIFKTNQKMGDFFIQKLGLRKEQKLYFMNYILFR